MEAATTRFAWERIAELTELELLFLEGLCEIRAENRVNPGRSFTLRMRQESSENLFQNVHREMYHIERTNCESTEPYSFLVYRYRLPTPDMLHQRSAVAFRLDAQGCPKPAPPKERVFYTFYPVSRERCGFPFYVHSYFRLSPNRTCFDLEQASITRNHILLEHLAHQITATIVPDLRNRYPDLLLPKVLLPQLEERDRSALEHLIDATKSGTLVEEHLTALGELTAYFTHKVLQRFAACDLVKDADGTWQQLGNLRLPHEQWLDEANDCLVAALCDVQDHCSFPPGLFGYSGKLRSVLDNTLEKFYFARQPLDLTTVCDAVAAAGQALKLSDAQAAAFLSLIGHCSPGQTQEDPLEKIREAAIPLLPCTSGLQPLPVHGRQTEPPSAKPPLVFFRPERSARQEDAEEESHAASISPPAFCHVHVLRDEVIHTAHAHLGPSGLRQIMREKLGMREFRPQDIFIRVAEAVYGSRQPQSLTPENHQELLDTTLKLLRRHVRRWAEEHSNTPQQPWFLRAADDNWNVHYWLAQSWIPVVEEGKTIWIRADEVILAGKLGRGEPLRQVYPAEINQQFLDEHNEAEWLCTQLNTLFDEAVPRVNSDGADLEQDRLRFRSTVYQMLGAWDGLRLHVVQPGGGRKTYAEAIPPRPNPHCDVSQAVQDGKQPVKKYVNDERWNDYVNKCQSSQWSTQTFRGDQFRLVRSAALPHAKSLAKHLQDPTHSDLREVFWKALEEALTMLKALRRVEVRNRGNVWGDTLSLLFYQLQELPWVLEKRDVPANSRIWYTTKQVFPRTSPQQEEHYLRSVTAKQITEPLARALGFPVLEDDSPEQLDNFIELWGHLCHRASQNEEPPGRGLEILFRTVATQLQHILLGRTRISQELIRQKRHGYRGQLQKLRDHGILIRDQAGRLCLYKNLNEVFYDDTAGSNPLFHDKLKLVVLGPTLSIPSR